MIEPSRLYKHRELKPGREIGYFHPLEKLPRIAHAVTTKSWGLFPKLAEEGQEQYAELANALELNGAAWVHQTHEADIKPVDTPGFADDADGLLTDTPGVGLLCRFADCNPIILAAKDGRAVGLAHASWRNSLMNITGKLITEMQNILNVPPSELIACIGPSAGPQSYIVGRDVYDAAHDALDGIAMPFFLPVSEEKWFMDLWALNVRQLMQAGVDFMDIYTSRIDTMQATDTYPSYRIEGEKAGRFAVMIGLKEE